MRSQDTQAADYVMYKWNIELEMSQMFNHSYTHITVWTHDIIVTVLAKRA